MCDQTQIEYVDGDIVWVKFRNLWWPGEVCDVSRLPPGLIESFRKLPFAVVKFFQEEAYEYVKTISEIYRYNCIRKHEFIKKGLDLYRSKTRKNMEKFPEDVAIAENRTGGDPNIIRNEEFQPVTRPNIASIFGDKTPKVKKGKGGRRKTNTPEDTDLPSHSRTAKRIQTPTVASSPAATPGRSNYPTYSSTPARSYGSPAASNATPTSTTSSSDPDYKCHHCDFSTNRINVIIFHNRTHSSEKKPAPAPVIETPPVAKLRATPVRKTPPATPKVNQRTSRQSHVETYTDETETDEDENFQGTMMGDVSSSSSSTRPSRKAATAAAATSSKSPPPKKRQPRKSVATSTVKVPARSTPTRKSHRKPPVATKAVVAREKLLADWDDASDTDGAVHSQHEKEHSLSSSCDVTEHVTSDGNGQSQTVSDSGDGDGATKTQQHAIRNIPKKDRRGIILDEFYASHGTIKEQSQNELGAIAKRYGHDSEATSTVAAADSQQDDPLAVIVLDSEDSDNELSRHTEDTKAMSDDENSDRRSNSSDDQVEEVITEIETPSVVEAPVVDTTNDTEQEPIGNEITVEKQNDGSRRESCESEKNDDPIINDKLVEVIAEAERHSEKLAVEQESEENEEGETQAEEDHRAKEENDLLLLQQSADLLHETTSLLKTAAVVATTTTKTSIEPIGVIGKKRRLQRKHRRTNESESVDESVDDGIKTSSEKMSADADEEIVVADGGVKNNRLLQYSDGLSIPHQEHGDDSIMADVEVNADEENVTRKTASPETVEIEEIPEAVGNNQEIACTDKPIEDSHEPAIANDNEIECTANSIEHISEAIEEVSEKLPDSEQSVVNEEAANGIEEHEQPSLVIDEGNVEEVQSEEIESPDGTETVHKKDKFTKEAEQGTSIKHNEIENESPRQTNLENAEKVERTNATDDAELIERPSGSKSLLENNVIEKSSEEMSKSEFEQVGEADATRTEIESSVAATTVESSNESVGSDVNHTHNDKFDKTGNEGSPTAVQISPAKNEGKMDVDCFDFKDEEEEFVPKSLNRRKRRCLPPGKRFELETMDKLEEIRKIEEEKAKRLKLEKEEKVKEKWSKSDASVENVVATHTLDAEEIALANVVVAGIAPGEQSSPEKNAADEYLKDGRSLPPKERGKRIFKSRNRSRQSEGDSFSNDEKTPAAREAAHPWDERESDTSPSKNSSESSSATASATVVLARSVSLLPVEIENKIEKTERRSTLDAEAIVSEVVDTLINLPMSSDLSNESKLKLGVKRPSINDPNDQSSPSKLMKPIKMTFALNSSSDSVRIVQADDTVSSERIETEVMTSDAPLDASHALITEKSGNNHGTSSERIGKSLGAVWETFGNNMGPDNQTSAIVFVDATVQSPVKTVTPVMPTKPVSTMPTEPKKRGGQRKSNSTGKVLMKIGYDTQGNPITVLRKPPTSPIVHLPSHIQTPDLAVPPNSSNTPTFNAKGSQIVITSKGTLLTTNATTNSTQMTATVSVSSSGKSARSSASVAYSTPIKSPAKIQVQSSKIICHGESASGRATSLLTSQSQVGLSQQQMLVDDLQKRGYIIKESTQSQKIQATKPKTAGTSRLTKKQQLQQQHQQQLQMQQEIARRQQEAAVRQQEAEKAADITQNIQDNQLLAIPADNFDGPPGSFYLCTAENNTYFPIDRQPLYLDDKNQLVPMPGATGPMNVAMNEDIVDDSTAQATVAATQEVEYASGTNASAAVTATATAVVAQEQTTTNLEDPSNLTYLINTGDGQQILLDQQSMLQLTAGGEMPQLITADGQQLILQGSPQDILAAISSSNPHHPEMEMVGGQQIIIPEEMTVIETEGNANHDILAAALADTEVFQQDQYIGDVIDATPTVEPNVLTFQTINQAATSETNAILPPIMSTLEQPSSKNMDVVSPSVDCANLDESLAVIGVSASQTNVPTSLELPITVTNPTISSAAAVMQPSTYELFDASTLPISSTTATAETQELDHNEHDEHGEHDEHDEHDATSMDIDSNSEIIPNTPDSVTNQARTPELTGFNTSDNSNSCEIPLQSNLILRTPSTDAFNQSSPPPLPQGPPPSPPQPPLPPLDDDHMHLQNNTTNHTANDDDGNESIVVAADDWTISV